MNCFEWKYRLSDFLDGSLSPTVATEAHHHVDSCVSCLSELKRVRAVIHELQQPARATLPTPIRRKYGAAAATAPKALQRKHLPWFLRLPIETLAILFVIVSVIEWAPKIRTFLSGRPASPSAALSGENASLTQPLEKSDGTDAGDGAREAADNGNTSMDDIDADDEEEAAAPARAHGRGRGEIWRFSFQAENPFDQRHKISAYLGDLDRRHKLALSEEALSGLEVPGGVQFQMQVPEQLADEIKSALEALGSPAQMASSPSATAKGLLPFAWYKTRSRQPLGEGMAKIVIWIPQI